MFTTRLFFRWQKMLLKMKVLYCPKLPQSPKFPHLTVHTILYCIGQCYHDHQLCNFSNIPYQDLVQDCSNSSALAMELLQSCTKPSISRSYFLAATKQLNDWFSPSVCPSVRLSVCDTFLTMFPSSYHHEIFRSWYQWQMWRPCKSSRSEVKGQGHRGHDPT